MNNEIKFVALTAPDEYATEVLRTETRVYRVTSFLGGAGWEVTYRCLRNGFPWQSVKKVVGTHHIVARNIPFQGREYIGPTEGRVPEGWHLTDFKANHAWNCFPSREAAVAAIQAHAAKK